jgi:hypothetical protein
MKGVDSIELLTGRTEAQNRDEQTNMNVVTYLRVSSEQQANRELSIPAQREALLKHAADKDWDYC